MNLLDKLEMRKGFKDFNIKFDRNNALQISETFKILNKFDVYKNEAKIRNLALLLSSEIYENMFERFEQLTQIPAAPSKKRLELIYVDSEIVREKFNEMMIYKQNKRKYTLKQFFSKPAFKQLGLTVDIVTTEQKNELVKCFDFFLTESNKYISQSDLFILVNFILEGDKDYLNYINRIKKLRELKGLHSTLEYKQIKYGKVNGQLKYNEFIATQSKANSLDVFIEKYGDQGLEKWNKLNNHRRKITKFNWSAEGFKKRFGDDWEHEQEKWKTKVTSNMDNLPKMRKASKSSLAVFLPVLDYFKNMNFDYQIGFEDLDEFIIDRWSYDLTIHSLKIIFEFQGIAFHPNPDWSRERIESWNQKITLKSAETVFSQDKFKKELAEKNGYKLFYVWEENNILDNIKYCIDVINQILLN